VRRIRGEGVLPLSGEGGVNSGAEAEGVARIKLELAPDGVAKGPARGASDGVVCGLPKRPPGPVSKAYNPS
jgi:hypothetical protein